MASDKLDGVLAKNGVPKESFDSLTYECLILSIFVQLCNYLEENDNKATLRKQLTAGTKGGERYIFSNFIKNHLPTNLSEDEMCYLADLLKAHLNKADKRKRMNKSTASMLLERQGNKCNYCNRPISMGSD